MSKQQSLEDRLTQIRDEAEAGEEDQTMRPIPDHVKVTRGSSRSKVLQVRLNPEEMAALEAIAERRELPVSTVAREQLLRLLAEAEQHHQPADILRQLMDAAERVQEFAQTFAADFGRQLPYGVEVSETDCAHFGVVDARVSQD